MAVYCGFMLAVYVYRKVEDHVTGKQKEDVRMEGHRGRGMAGKTVEAQQQQNSSI